jgi:hypothetical protein
MENSTMDKDKALSMLGQVAYLMGHAEARGEDLVEYVEDHRVAHDRAKELGASVSELDRTYNRGYNDGKTAYQTAQGVLSKFFGSAPEAKKDPVQPKASGPAPMLHSALERHPEGQVRVYSKNGKLVMGTSVSGYIAELEEWHGEQKAD